MSILIKKSQADSFQVDDATTINKYNFSTGDYDAVEIIVNGHHGTMMNNRSTKSYFITSGTATFNIDGTDYQVEPGDIITVKPGGWLKIIGNNLKAFIITNPPFSIDDEEWRDRA
jgi:mannose-6-phosphate isomerase-like protein (cupin superfamily)